jgi:hypothetical protein
MSKTLKIQATVVFLKIKQSLKRFCVNQGGTRSSKTYSIVQFIIVLCLEKTGLTISIIRKTLPSLKRTAEKDFLDLLKKYKLYDELNHNKTERIYYLNGNSIEFFSTEDDQKVRGSKRDILWVNEANEISVEVFRQLNIRTSDKIFLDYNPDIENDHWIIDEVLSRADDPNYNDVDFIQSTYKDNPFLNDAQIKEVERFKEIDPSFWQVFGEGIRATLQKGNVFLKKHYSEFEDLPNDVKSVLYTDPNLSIKSKGDSTAIVHLGFSPSSNDYYVIDPLCKSFADAEELLNEVYLARRPFTYALGFDGNVTQESTWTNFVKNWSKIKAAPFPPIHYKRYRVDDLSKNVQLVWNQGKIKFPAGFSSSLHGKIFLNQLFAFTSKKAGLKDDAPDALICAFEFLHEKKLDHKPAIGPQIIIKDSINF